MGGKKRYKNGAIAVLARDMQPDPHDDSWMLMVVGGLDKFDPECVMEPRVAVAGCPGNIRLAGVKFEATGLDIAVLDDDLLDELDDSVDQYDDGHGQPAISMGGKIARKYSKNGSVADADRLIVHVRGNKIRLELDDDGSHLLTHWFTLPKQETVTP